MAHNAGALRVALSVSSFWAVQVCPLSCETETQMLLWSSPIHAMQMVPPIVAKAGLSLVARSVSSLGVPYPAKFVPIIDSI